MSYEGFSCNYKGSIIGAEYNDLYLDENGNIATSSGNDAIEENCYHALQMLNGEYDFNTSIGIPWQTYLSSDYPVGNQIRLSITQALLAVDGVNSISAINLSIGRDTRILNVSVVINLTTNTTITINTTI